MLVKFYYSRKVSPRRMDALLARGWFRGGAGFHRTALLCMDRIIGTVVETRFDLRKHTFSRSQRKLMARNSHFRTLVQPLYITPEMERLYALTKHRFKGFVHETLAAYFHDPFWLSPFHTQQLEIYDGDKLVAVSFFDAGHNSLMSVMGLYDPDYPAHSLGMYTMLQEVCFAKEKNISFYYPGYVVHELPDFDYKLRIGKPSFLAPSGRWISDYDRVVKSSVLIKIHERLQLLEQYFTDRNISYTKSIYKYYGLGYQPYLDVPLYRFPYILVLHTDTTLNTVTAVTWDHETGMYRLDVLEIMEDIVINAHESNEYADQEAYCQDILRLTSDTWCFEETTDLDHLVHSLLAQFIVV